MAKSTYVISDIHGQYNAFMKLLEMIEFSEEDEMYIVGDLIDRGPDSLKLIEWAMNHDNVLPMLGNHELMYVDNYTHDYEGLYNTIEEARAIYDESKLEEIAQWICDMPECKLVKANGRQFYLCHTQALNREYFNESLTDRLFPDYDRYKMYNDMRIKDIISIFGHIPTMQMRAWCDQERDNHIWFNKDKSIIDIDCGAGYPDKGGCLGCLRLNDMKEFYENILR